MRKPLLIGAGLAWLASVGLANAEPLTLDQAVASALAKGADQTILNANLATSRAANALAQAKAGYTLAAAGTYGASQTWNDPASTAAQVAAASKVATVGVVGVDGAQPQSVTSSLTLAGPVTSLTASDTQNLQFDSTGNLNRTSTDSVALSQTIWNGYLGGPLQAAADKAALAVRVAELNAQANRNKLILSVKQAFFTLFSAQESMAAFDQTRNQRRDTLKFTQAKFDLGQATELDLKSARINFISADLDWQGGKSALAIARQRLANLMGVADDESITAAFEPDPTIPADLLTEAVTLALKNRVEPQIALANSRSAQIDQGSAFGALLPSVSVTAKVAYNKDWQTNKSSVLGTLGASLGLPILDAGAAGALGASADAARLAADTQFQQLSASIPVDVTEAWNAWKVNAQRLSVAQTSVELAQGQHDVTQAQYDAGLKTLTDLQTADLNLTTAQFNLIKAKITLQLSALTLLNLLGL